MELLNDAGSEYTAGTKLHFKIRMKAKDYKGKLGRGILFSKRVVLKRVVPERVRGWVML
jgi:hypothetical protein